MSTALSQAKFIVDWEVTYLWSVNLTIVTLNDCCFKLKHALFYDLANREFAFFLKNSLCQMLLIYFKYSASYNNKNNNIITIDMYTQKELAKATN